MKSQTLRSCLRCTKAVLHRAAPTHFQALSQFYGPRCRCAYPSNRQIYSGVQAAAQAAEAPPAAPGYDAEHIQVLEGLEPVRKRPGMYIGSTGQKGLHHLVYEILDNAIDEVQAGHATQVEVEMDPASGWVRVTDNGRGIPVDEHPSTGRSALETVLTVLHAGGKFGGEGSGYSVSGGLHGVGMSVVNALSEQLEVTVWRNGSTFTQAYRCGKAQTPLAEEAGQLSGASPRSGTRVAFRYDHTVFSNSAAYDPPVVRARLRELAFLNSQATLRFRAGKRQPPASTEGGPSPAAEEGDQAEEEALTQEGREPSRDCGSDAGLAPPQPDWEAVGSGWEELHFAGGLWEFVEYVNRAKTPLHKPICFCEVITDSAGNRLEVDVALQWCKDSFTDTIVGFANSIRTVDGGMHIDGLKAALTRSVQALAKAADLVKDSDPGLTGDYVREGLGAVVAVKLANPEFEGQTKTRLGNPEVRKAVYSLTSERLMEMLEDDRAALAAIVAKALEAARAAEAAKRARELVRRKNVLTKSTLPGKLSDCSSTSCEETEIFIVEGDSAGGSAKQARDRMFQAVLPLRGKILNVDRKDDAALYKNKELGSLIVALGLGMKGEEDLAGLRYGKIIMLTDADVDGAHIRTLLLNFLFRYQPELFARGHVYAGVPPLYKVEAGRKRWYCYDDAELRATTAELKARSFTVQRFKGLGEMMPAQLWDTTMDPARRRLRRLTIRDAQQVNDTLSMLMGKKVEPRRQLIEEHASSFSISDLDL